jgi:hypothetical protein
MIMKRAALIVACALAMGCGTQGEDVERYGEAESVPKIVRRPAAVMVEGCGLDSWQRSTLATSATRAVLQEVIFNCPTMRLSGVVDPVDDTARAAMTKDVGDLRAQGYKVKLAVTLGDQFDRPNPPDRTLAAFQSADWRAKVIANLVPFIAMADGIEIFLLEVPSSIRTALTTFISELAAVPRGSKSLALLAPPSVTEPSDIPGGDAFDIPSLSRVVDRIRLMTLDFSCCGAGPGPTIDSGWAVDVARLAQSRSGGAPIDVSFPLYGTDFSDLGERPVTFLEAHATAKYHGIIPQRALTGTLHFEWREPTTGRRHITWFEDGISTVRALRSWDDRTLPPNVGIVYYGLGAEEPRLWETIARGLQ